MCSGFERKKTVSYHSVMEGVENQKQDGVFNNFSVLLELAASDDLIGFKTGVGEEDLDVNESGYWYGRRGGSKKLGFEERTPLMIASMFGSKQVLNYILQEGRVDVNKACGSDGATALHCAIAGGSASLPEVVKLLIDASADVNCVDANGNRPVDLITLDFKSSFNLRRKMFDLLLKRSNGGVECVLSEMSSVQTEEQQDQEVSTKKEFPVDPSLPDIKNGIYGTDEFRMYMFKIKPCSRAYSHDWTECPFVHPGENARRRDPRRHHYTCVPCPEFRKGTCRQGDACDYAHGIFECWLHPAQYRTRLCKDETGCVRKVCFFAHKPDELRPLYASTGSAVPSPRSFLTSSSLESAPISPFALGSSTPPVTPRTSSPMGGSMWQNQPNLVPPTLNLSGSRLKTTLSARDMGLDAELIGFENHHHRQDKPTNLDDIFGYLDPSILYQLHGLSMDAETTQLQSPTGIQTRYNMNQQFRPSYPSSPSASPVRMSPSFGNDVLNSRSAAFSKRSQSFIDRSGVNHHSGISSSASSAAMAPSTLSDWGSPDGKLDWGIQQEQLSKLRKSASFGFRGSGSSFPTPAASIPTDHEPNLSWVQSMVNDVPPEKPGSFNIEEQQQHQQYHLNSSEMLSSWAEQLYMEQEQWVA